MGNPKSQSLRSNPIAVEMTANIGRLCLDTRGKQKTDPKHGLLPPSLSEGLKVDHRLYGQAVSFPKRVLKRGDLVHTKDHENIVLLGRFGPPRKK